MLIRRRQVFAEISPEASLGVTAVWTGAVGALLLIIIVARMISWSAP
jgi:hypothetical protein